jgi:ADP-Ribosyltransferase in polyvalent proteins
MALDPFGPSAGLDPAAPVAGLDPFAPDPNAPGPFKRGLRTGVADLKSIGAGVAQYAGRLTGFGALEKGAAAYGQTTADESAPYRMQVEDVGNAFDQGVGPGLGATADLVKYTIGNQIPMMATAIVGGIAGRVGAGALGLTKAAAGLSAVEKAAAVARVAAGTGTAGDVAVAHALKAADIGAELGVLGSSSAMEMGQIAPEGLKPENNAGLGQMALGSLVSGATDTVLPIYLARKLGLIGAAERALIPRAAGFGAVAKDAAATALKAGTFETGQEGLQTYIERLSANQALTGPEANSDVLNSAVMGGIMGLVSGGVAGGVHGLHSPIAAPVAIDNATGQPVLNPSTNVPNPGPIDPNSGVPLAAPTTPEALHAQLSTEHAAATQAVAAAEPLLAEAQTTHSELVAKRDALVAESKLEVGNRRTKSEILTEKKSVQAQVVAAKAKIEELGGSLNQARSAVAELTPRLEAAKQLVGTSEQVATNGNPVTAPTTDSLVPTAPVVSEHEQVQRAVAGTQAAMADRGLAPAQTQQDRIAAAATPDIKELVATKLASRGESLINGISNKVQRAVTAALALPTVEARQAAILKTVPKAFANKIAKVDAEQFAADLSKKVGDGTLYSKGATEPGSYANWKQAQEYEGRLFGGAYDASRIGPGPGPKAAKDSFFAKAIPMARERYNALRAEFGLQPVTDWKTRPARDQLVQYVKAPEQESHAALTQDEFDHLPEPAKFAAVDEFNRVMMAKGTELRTRVVQMLGPRAGLIMKTFMATPDSPIGSYTRVDKLKSVISMALNAKDGLSIADHEGYHAAEDLVLTSAEKQIITNALKEGRPMAQALLARVQQYDLANRTNLADEVTAVPAEARAYAYEFWKRGELKAEGPLARIFAKLRQFFERIKNAVDGLGFKSMEDIFTALDRGQYAERESNSGQITETPGKFGKEGVAWSENPAMQMSRSADYLQSPEFKKWFGDSKVVDAEGKPLVVYHATLAEYSRFKRTRGAHFGFHFGTVDAAHERLEDTAQASNRGSARPDVTARQEQALRGAEQIRTAARLRAVLPENFNDQFLTALKAEDEAKISSLLALQQGELTPDERTRLAAHELEFKDLSAAHLAGLQYGREGANVLPVYLAIRKPLRSKDAGNWGAVSKVRDATGFGGASLAEVMTNIERAGYDGIIYKNAVEDRIMERDSYIAFRPTQIKSAIGNTGAFDPNNPDIRFSQAAIAPLIPDHLRAMYSKAAVAAADDLNRRAQAGELERTQAQQQFMKMADNAKLPDNMASFAFGLLKSEFAGGLQRWWFTNVATPNLVSKYSNGYKNVQQTLNTYIRYRKILAEQMLREKLPSWYKAADGDRKAAFGVMLKRTVEGYSANSSELAALRQGLTTAQNKLFDQATGMIAGFLTAQFESQKITYRKFLTTEGAYEKWVADRQSQVQSLIDKGYVPLKRYGDHSVRVFVETPDGKRIDGGLQFFDRAAAANAAAEMYKAEIARSGAKLQVEVGIRSKNARETGVSIEQFLGTLQRNGVAISQAERERLVQTLTTADSLIRNRMMHREGLPGYSDDSMRVLHEFGVGMSGELAYAKFASAIDAASEGGAVTADVNSVNSQPEITVGETFGKDEATGAPNNLWERDGPMSGFYKNIANELSNYVLVPDHSGGWSRRLRAAAMVYFIGGSLSGAMVNAMSIPMMTVPELSLHTNYVNALSTTMGAWKDAWQHYNVLRDMDKMRDPSTVIPGMSPELRQAIVAAADHIFDTEIHQMLGMSQGTVYSKSRNVQRAMEAWMAPFRVSEQTNRLASFIAAYKIASQDGVKQADGSVKKLSGQELFKFASGIVDSTQNNYNESNRPGVARNPVFALMFQFKSFPLFMIEAIHLMYKQNPKSAVYMLLGLTMMTGVQGLPFAETIEDLIDTVSQNIFGSPFNTRRAMRNAFKSASEAMVGVDLSELALRGAINDIVGVSASSRIGTGDFMPGTRAGTADADQGKVLAQFLGAPYSMVHDAVTNVGKLAGGAMSGDWKQMADAVRAGGPIALRNVVKGSEQLSSGYASDPKGRKVLDVTTIDGLLQLGGLTSAGVNKANEFEKINIQTKAYYTQVSADMEQQFVQAAKANDVEKMQKISNLRAEWNREYPEMPMMASAAATRRGLALAGVPMDVRSRMQWGRRLGGANIFTENAGQQ